MSIPKFFLRYVLNIISTTTRQNKNKFLLEKLTDLKYDLSFWAPDYAQSQFWKELHQIISTFNFNEEEKKQKLLLDQIYKDSYEIYQKMLRDPDQIVRPGKIKNGKECASCIKSLLSNNKLCYRHKEQ